MSTSPTIDAERSLNAALSAHRVGKITDAESHYQRALSLRPDHPDALNLYALLLMSTQRPALAEPLLRRAIALRPNIGPFWVALGSALTDQGRHAEAVAAFDRSLSLQSTSVDAWYRSANARRLAGDLTGAEAAYRRAVALQPSFAQAWSNLAAILLAQDRLDEAMTAVRRAIDAKPTHARAWSNLGSILQAQNHWPAAVDAYRRAVELNPDDAEARWNHSLSMLATGDFALGWAEYEARWSVPNFPSPRRSFDVPLWDGSPDRIVLVHAEQGFGDTIQFARYVPLLTGRGCRVVFEVHPELHRLLSTTPGTLAVIPRGSTLPAVDAHCPLMTLPLRTNVPVQPTPASVWFDPDRAEDYRRRLNHRPAIGVAWAGAPTHGNDRNRSMPAELLSQLSSAGTLVSLQKGRSAPAGMIDWSAEWSDFADTAALVSVLDRVISVDTAVAHLAATMGKPTDLLLPFSADYRWLVDRADSPWYPSMRLLRQPSPGDWSTIVRRSAGVDSL